MNKYCKKYDVKLEGDNCFEFCIERDLDAPAALNATNCLEIFITFDENVN